MGITIVSAERARPPSATDPHKNLVHQIGITKTVIGVLLALLIITHDIGLTLIGQLLDIVRQMPDLIAALIGMFVQIVDIASLLDPQTVVDFNMAEEEDHR